MKYNISYDKVDFAELHVEISQSVKILKDNDSCHKNNLVRIMHILKIENHSGSLRTKIYFAYTVDNPNSFLCDDINFRKCKGGKKKSHKNIPEIVEVEFFDAPIKRVLQPICWIPNVAGEDVNIGVKIRMEPYSSGANPFLHEDLVVDDITFSTNILCLED